MNNITKIKVRTRPRYWQDCMYSTDNGVTWISPDDTNEEGIKVMKLLPCVEFLDDDKYDDWYWCLEIDYDTGKVDDWKEGYCVETHFKVCDDGYYQIIDDKNNIVWDSVIENKNYVPKFLELDSSWFGDYILITVNGDGVIKNWGLAKERISELLENKQ